MISIKDLSLSFGSNLVLNNINYDFPLNKIYGIIGLNGSGKTTFFNTLSTLMRPTAGEIYFSDREIYLKDINYLETVNFFYSRITVNEYLKFFKQTNDKINRISVPNYTKVPLDDLIETYSTGMKKKLAIRSILKKDKPIFLFDEPFNGVDMETNKIIELIILALKEKGKTIFISSHILDPLIQICDKIFFLENGMFTKSYAKSDYNEIEKDLFGDLKHNAISIISESV